MRPSAFITVSGGAILHLSGDEGQYAACVLPFVLSPISLIISTSALPVSSLSGNELKLGETVRHGGAFTYPQSAQF